MKKLFKLLSLPLFAVFATAEIEASSTHSSLTIGSVGNDSIYLQRHGDMTIGNIGNDSVYLQRHGDMTIGNIGNTDVFIIDYPEY